MSKETKRIAVLGAGRMGGALVRALNRVFEHATEAGYGQGDFAATYLAMSSEP